MTNRQTTAIRAIFLLAALVAAAAEHKARQAPPAPAPSEQPKKSAPAKWEFKQQYAEANTACN